MSRHNGVSWKHPARSTGHGQAASGARRGLGVGLVVVGALLVVGSLLAMATLVAGSGGIGSESDDSAISPGANSGANPGTNRDTRPGRPPGRPGSYGSGQGPPVELPAGNSTERGYPVGFPQTELGAVAVPVELSRAQIGFDDRQATTAAAVYSEETDRPEVVARAEQAVAYRRTELGVPARGPVPAPASFALTPYAFRLTDLEPVLGPVLGRTPDRYLVTVLNVASSTHTNGTTTTGYYAGTQVVTWTKQPAENGPADEATAQTSDAAEGDWKVVDPTGRDLAQLANLAEPELAPPGDLHQLRAAGWTPIATDLAQTGGGIR